MPAGNRGLFRTSGPPQPGSFPWYGKIHATGTNFVWGNTQATWANLGFFFYVTDTNVIYQCQLVSGKPAWVVIVAPALQADQTAGSPPTGHFVTPLTQQYHDSAAKAWVEFSATGGTVTVNRSYNVTSVTRNGVGDYTLTFTTAFADAFYTAHVTGRNSAGVIGMENHSVPTRTTTTLRIFTLNATGSGTNDPDVCSVTCLGRQ